MAPVNAPFSWPKSSLSSSPAGMAAQFSLTKVRSAARAQAMDGAGQQFFSGACFALDEHGCIGGRDGFNLA